MKILDRKTCTLDDLAEYQRINVIGTSGSGKSTFARRLGTALQLPYIEMDQLFWKPQWEESTDEEFLPKVEQVTARSHWILDGNYSSTLPIKLSRAQLLVWIDLPFLATTYSVTRRAIKRSFSGKEIWPDTGNRETLKKSFLSKDSIIWWSMTHHRSGRTNYEQLMQSEHYTETAFLRITSRKQIARLFNPATSDG